MRYHFACYAVYFINEKNSLNSLMYILIEETISKSKVGDHSRGWPEGSLFNSYYTKV